jgi:hypothetical protein
MKWGAHTLGTFSPFVFAFRLPVFRFLWSRWAAAAAAAAKLIKAWFTRTAKNGSVFCIRPIFYNNEKIGRKDRNFPIFWRPSDFLASVRFFGVRLIFWRPSDFCMFV